MAIKNKVVTVRLVWTIEDIKRVKPTLTDEQCLEVFKKIKKDNLQWMQFCVSNDTWLIIKDAIDELKY
jgi:hypothetical protein